MPPSFESLRSAIEQISTPPDNDSRRVHWVIPGLLGVAADYRGGREVFIVGPRLVASTSTVRRHIEYGRWVSVDRGGFEANRVVLPPATHFATLAALISSELLRAGLGASGKTNQQAFSQVEPLIALSLKKGLLTEQAVSGLLGELLVLVEMLDAISGSPEKRSAVLDSWRGPERAARDFLAGTTAIEVKTTTLQSSIHHIHSLSQIEPDGSQNSPERELFLLSIGMTPAFGGPLSLPDKADRVLELLSDQPGGEPREGDLNPLQVRFLSDLSNYSVGEGEGYDHRTMRGMPAYATTFTTTFEPRLFLTTDPDFKVIRRASLAGTFVSPDDISYKIVLPDKPLNASNPAVDWRDAIRRITRAAVGLE